MEEETLRKMAIQQYLQGKTPISIFREMGRSQKGFFKWLGRYQSGDAHRCQDKPKTPHGHHHETPPEMQKPVKNIRIQREGNAYAQIGTSAITWEFNKLGITPPFDRTINMLEDFGHARLSSSRQTTLFSGKQSFPSFLRRCPQTLSFAGNRTGLHSERRTVA